MLNARRAHDDPQLRNDSAAWPEPWPVLELTLEDRQRWRLAAMLPNGRAVAVILPRTEHMQHGDILCGDQGERVVVQAAVEELFCIQASSPFELMRIVYHLANRHVRAMLSTEAVWIQPDPVLADMVRRLGGTVTVVQQAFIPEGGAYAAGQGGEHHHHHHASECGVEEHDQAMGNLGEELSIAAHARSKS
ncbi:MAG: urease accessory protein UreE [Burkholderiaceae bacterium]|jgi:urease accessory protein|nr:urease accessory protein UreE [Burkholderiaceae bacterium]